MGKRLSSTFRSRYDQPAYDDFERRCRGKVKWAGISIADAFKHQDYSVRIPAQRQFYETCRKLQAKAAGLAGARIDASFQPKVKPQLAPCYSAYPSGLVAAFAALGLTAFLEYENQLGQNLLKVHLQGYLKDTAEAVRAGVDPQAWSKTAEDVTKTVQARLLLEDLTRSSSMACVEIYRLLAAAEQSAKYDTLLAISESIILYGDVLGIGPPQTLHPTTRQIVQDLGFVCGPFFDRLATVKPHLLVPLGMDWVRSVCTTLLKYLPPPSPNQTAGDSSPRDVWIPPLDSPRPPLLETPDAARLVSAAFLGRATTAAPSGVQESPEAAALRQKIEAFSQTLSKASGQQAQFEDMRSDLVQQALRGGSFRESPIQGNPTEGHEVQVRLGKDTVAAGEVFDRPVELSDDLPAYQDLLAQSRAATEALKRTLYPNTEEFPLTERLRTSGTLDPARLSVAACCSAVFKRTRMVERADRRGKPVLLIACDGSGSLNAQQIGMLKVLAAAWLNSTVQSGVQVLAALYHSGEIRRGLSGPLVQWIYHPRKTPATGRKDAARALVSLPNSGTGCQSDALSVAFLLDEARTLARGRMVYLILLTDTAWNRSFNTSKDGKQEMLDLLQTAYDESSGKLHVTLVALGLTQPDTGFENIVDKVLTVSNEQLTDYAGVAQKIAVYVASTMKERHRLIATR